MAWVTMNQWITAINSWIWPKLQTGENASEQFERIWCSQKSGHKINFMSVAFNTLEDSADEIQDIGLSHWSRHNFFQQQVVHHWRIGEKVEARDETDFGNPDAFEFGTTQTITAQDVRTVLNDWAWSLSTGCEELCIVMYGKRAIKALRRCWKSPVTVTVLDLEAVWQQRHKEAVHATFEEVTSILEDVANVTSNLDHAGNRAYCQIALFNALGKEKKKTVLELENIDN